MDYRQKYKSKTKKLLENNTGENLEELQFDN